MATVLSAEEKERVRYHLGYMGTGDAASIQLGIPRPVQTMFLVESAMDLVVSAHGLNRIRRLVSTLDTIELKLADGVDLLLASELGELKLRGSAVGHTSTDLIEREYVRWAKRLADTLGVPLYPYAERFRKSGAGGNVPVRQA